MKHASTIICALTLALTSPAFSHVAIVSDTTDNIKRAVPAADPSTSEFSVRSKFEDIQDREPAVPVGLAISAGIYAGKKLYGAWKNRNKGKRDFVDDDLMLERDFLDALADVIISRGYLDEDWEDVLERDELNEMD